MQDGQNIPKATMANFIRNKYPNMKISDQFIKCMLSLSKEYVTKISNKANDICQQQGKKVINSEHLFAALLQSNAANHIPLLKDLQKDIKQKDRMDKQRRQIVEVNSRQLNKRYSQQQGIQISFANKVQVKQSFIVLSDSQNDSSVMQDYEAALQAENQKKKEQNV